MLWERNISEDFWFKYGNRWYFKSSVNYVCDIIPKFRFITQLQFWLKYYKIQVQSEGYPFLRGPLICIFRRKFQIAQVTCPSLSKDDSQSGYSLVVNTNQCETKNLVHPLHDKTYWLVWGCRSSCWIWLITSWLVIFLTLALEWEALAFSLLWLFSRCLWRHSFVWSMPMCPKWYHRIFWFYTSASLVPCCHIFSFCLSL